MFDLAHSEVQFAMRAVRQAALLVKRIQAERASTTLTKQDLSPVTVADFASQALIARLLAGAFPDDPLVGEEDSTALRAPDQSPTLDSVTAYLAQVVPEATPAQVCAWIDRGRGAPANRFWTLDPIDGTKGFLRDDQFAVALALIIAGRVRVGVLGCPNLQDGTSFDTRGQGSLIVAAQGQGTWVAPLAGQATFKPLSVSGRVDPEQARVLRSFESGHTNVDQVEAFAGALGARAEPIRMDSQAKYAMLAAGGGDLYLRLLSPDRPGYRERIWDQAAGSLIVEEAGGRVTDLLGTPLDFTAGRTLAHNRGVLASNGHLHELALAALRQIGA